MGRTLSQTVDILNDAAAFAEKDDLKGISQCIMLGQLGRMGTGEFGIVLNEKMLEEAIEVQLSTLDGGEVSHCGGGEWEWEWSPHKAERTTRRCYTPYAPVRLSKAGEHPLVSECVVVTARR